MDPIHKKKRKEARRLFLVGEAHTNAEIGRRLGLKPHTVARYRKEEDWDGLKLRIDRRAAEKMVEQIATDRVNLNVRHFKYWEVLLNEALVTLKSASGKFDTRGLVEMAGIIDKAQKGQRLARGLGLDGQTEEEVRAQSEAGIRHLIDTFIESVKEHVSDEEVRERIRRSVLEAVPDEPEPGSCDPGDTITH